MRLSAELFEEIVDALKSDSHTDRDKRLEPRVGMAGEVSLIASVDNSRRVSVKVRVRDISRSGLGIYYSRRFKEGQRFILQLQSHMEEPMWLVCVTAYCRKAESDRFVIGGRIQQVLRSEQIRKLEGSLGSSAIDSFLNPSSPEALRIGKAILA